MLLSPKTPRLPPEYASLGDVSSVGSFFGVVDDVELPVPVPVPDPVPEVLLSVVLVSLVESSVLVESVLVESAEL